MSAELLRRAAKVLREHVEATSGPTWVAAADGLVWAERSGDPISGSEELGDANYIALMHPPVALALAVVLDTHAEVAESNDEHDGFDLTSIDDTYVAAVQVARTITQNSGDDHA